MRRIEVVLAVICITLFAAGGSLCADQKEFRIGVLNSLTGTFAAAGALATHRGTMVAIDMINERGGVAGQYKVVPVVADAQSNPDVAVKEAERLWTVENVPVVVGVFSSVLGVPLAPVAEKHKKVFLVSIANSDKVLQGRHLKYVFRMHPMGSQWGQGSVEAIRENCAKFGYADPKDIRVAVIREDGPFGATSSAASLALLKKYGMQVVLDEAYSVKSQDLSPLIVRLKAANPDAILHTGYFPDVVLFLRQAKELGLKTKAIFGHGAGHANFLLLRKTVDPSMVLYLFNLNPAPAQTLDVQKLAPGQGDLIKEFLERYRKDYSEPNPPSQATGGFSYTWILLNEVAPLALKKYGDLGPESIRKAFAEIDIPDGATPCGFGVKFAPPEDEFAGQNIRSYPVVTQFTKGKLAIVWPKSVKIAEPIIPMPEDSPYSTK
ncbi:MAG: ABC transporter substrate-binding protein [Desulfomonile tiedjei]|nr:ABC transporter substrate-binding protein [Desulfomonile tiedjei]